MWEREDLVNRWLVEERDSCDEDVQGMGEGKVRVNR